MTIPKALTIAGSDSGAGAGIQADLKTYAALGVYGACAITAVTAQNTCGVQQSQSLAPDLVAAQIDAVMGDIGAHAVKVGMLGNGAIVEAVADRVRHWAVSPLVVDPVLASTSGSPLLDPAGEEALKRDLIPLALVLTPNLPEAERLTGRTDPREAARALHDMGARYVVVTGGHAGGDTSDDVLFDGQTFVLLHAQRVDTAHTHGTGCTFSAAIAALLAKGLDVPAAAAEAKRFVTAALEHAFAIGAGRSPLHHFFALW